MKKLVLAFLLVAGLGLATAQEPSIGLPIAREGAGWNADLNRPFGVPQDTCEVLNLQDNGRNSLRGCINGDRRGPRTVIVKVGGVVQLLSPIIIKTPYLTIDGSQAPEPGLTVKQPGKNQAGLKVVATHDIVVHSIRIEGGLQLGQGSGIEWAFGADGDGNPATVSWDPDPETPSGRGVKRILWSHVAGRGAWDDIGSFWCDAKNVSAVGMLLTENFHPITTGCKGWYAQANPKARKRVSFLRNFFAFNGDRQVIIREGVYGWDYINNVVFRWKNWGGPAGSGPSGFGLQVDGDTNKFGNIVGNAFLPGGWRPDWDCFYGNTPKSNDNAFTQLIHSSDNIFSPQHNPTECASKPVGQGLFVRPYPLPILPSEELRQVILKAGPRWVTREEQAAKDAALARLEEALQ